MTATDPRKPAQVLLVTGLSGAGKSSALDALEDMGYEAVDNLPLSLLGAIASPEGGFVRPVAIGVDVRTRDFDVGRLDAALNRARTAPNLAIRVLFMDCDDEALIRRFESTRRRHPLAVDRPLPDGIRDERMVLAPVRERADLVIDTSGYSLADLREELAARFDVASGRRLNIAVTTFSYAHGLPRGADLVLDVRFLDNPHYVPALKPLTGRDRKVAEYIASSAGFDSFFDSLLAMLLPLLPRYEREGKSYLTIAFGCTGGRHRSVYVAERLAEAIRGKGLPVTVRHRELDRET